MRSVLNIALTEMTYRKEHNVTIGANTCPASNGVLYIAERQGFEWSEELQGIILGAFYWGSIVFNLKSTQ